MPLSSKTSSPSRCSSNASSYWKPEQPPPRTPTRRPAVATSAPCDARNSRDLLGALVGDRDHGFTKYSVAVRRYAYSWIAMPDARRASRTRIEAGDPRRPRGGRTGDGGDHFRATVVSAPRSRASPASHSTASSTTSSATRSAAASTPCPSRRRPSEDPHERRDQPRSATRSSEAIAENAVILFMKGTPEQPMCGFSARTVARAAGARHAVRRRRHPARPAHPPGALGALELADDPAAVRQGRAGRRRRHRHRDVRDRRAGRSCSASSSRRRGPRGADGSPPAARRCRSRTGWAEPDGSAPSRPRRSAGIRR